LFIKCLQFISSGQTVTYVIMNMYSKGDVIWLTSINTENSSSYA
jgi:hypothetical protein